MGASKQDLIDLSDEVWERTRTRVTDLGDDEYWWEPAPGCWTLRQRPDGRWVMEGMIPQPEPEPPTTIAWRLWHLIDMYGEDRAPRWLDVAPVGPPIGLDAPDPSAPTTAAEALNLLDRAHDRWDAHLAAVSEQGLTEPIGPVGGRYAERSRAAYVLHMLDEFVHHGAEIGVLRDLWRWQHPIGDDEIRERVMRGQPVAPEDAPASAEDRANLVTLAAQYGRWGLVTSFVGAGFGVGSPGRTALHMAAAAGELPVVQLLVAHGADTDAIDPDFEATPAQWAGFFDRSDVTAWLEAPA